MSVPKLRFKEFNGDWRGKKIGDISQCIVPGRNKPKLFDGDIPWVTTPDLKGKTYVSDTRSNYYISEEEAKSVGSKIVPINSVIMSCVGDLGLFAINTKPVVINQQLHAFILDDYKYSSIFVLNALSKNQDYIEKVATKTALPYLNKDNCNSIPLFLCTFQEQTKIASFLSEVDEKISQLTQKHELLSQYKQGMMQKLFSQQIRFKADDGSEFGDWENISVKEIFDVTRGQVLAVSNTVSVADTDYKYPVFSSQTKQKGLMGFYKKYLFEDALTWTTDGANAGDVNFRKGKFYCTNVCGVLLSKKGYANLCIAEILNKVTHKYVSYVGNPKLMNNVMSEIPITIPSNLEEQTKIANFISAIDQKIEVVAQQIEQAKQWKKGLLQQMFV